MALLWPTDLALRFNPSEGTHFSLFQMFGTPFCLPYSVFAYQATSKYWWICSPEQSLPQRAELSDALTQIFWFLTTCFFLEIGKLFSECVWSPLENLNSLPCPSRAWPLLGNEMLESHGRIGREADWGELTLVAVSARSAHLIPTPQPRLCEVIRL